MKPNCKHDYRSDGRTYDRCIKCGQDKHRVTSTNKKGVRGAIIGKKQLPKDTISKTRVCKECKSTHHYSCSKCHASTNKIGRVLLVGGKDACHANSHNQANQPSKPCNCSKIVHKLGYSYHTYPLRHQVSKPSLSPQPPSMQFDNPTVPIDIQLMPLIRLELRSIWVYLVMIGRALGRVIGYVWSYYCDALLFALGVIAGLLAFMCVVKFYLCR